MSDIRFTTLKDSGGSNSSTTSQIFEGRARAWVNFNGTGSVGIRKSYNVNSISDRGTGQYTVNFSSSINSGYCSLGNSGDFVGQTRRDMALSIDAPNSGSCEVYGAYPQGGLWDFGQCHFVAISDN